MNDRKDDPERGGADTQRSPSRTEGSPTAAQLRADIDTGRARDKVAHSDPAAAPLGTDDEASGSPPTDEQVSTARRHETGRDVPDPAPADQPEQAGMAPKARYLWMIGGVVVVCALVGIALSI